MHPDIRHAEIQDERDAETLHPLETRFLRQGLIAEHHLAEGRSILATLLAWHRPLTIHTAQMILGYAPKGLTIAEATSLAARVVEADQTSLGVTHGH